MRGKASKKENLHHTARAKVSRAEPTFVPLYTARTDFGTYRTAHDTTSKVAPITEGGSIIKIYWVRSHNTPFISPITPSTLVSNLVTPPLPRNVSIWLMISLEPAVKPWKILTVKWTLDSHRNAGICFYI